MMFPGMLDACLLVMCLLPFRLLKNWGLGRPLNGLWPLLKGAPPLLGGLDLKGGLPGRPGLTRVEPGDEPEKSLSCSCAGVEIFQSLENSFLKGEKRFLVCLLLQYLVAGVMMLSSPLLTQHPRGRCYCCHYHHQSCIGRPSSPDTGTGQNS